MSKSSAPQPRNTPGGTGGDDIVSNAIQELLNSIRNKPGQQRMEQSVNMERTAADYSAIVLRGQVESQRVQLQQSASFAGAADLGLDSISTDLQRMVQQVRAHYMVIADMEVRRMLDEVLFGGKAPRMLQGIGERAEVEMQFGEEQQSYETFTSSIETGEAEQADEPAEDVADDQVIAEEPAGPEANNDLFEGTVKLVVMAQGNMQRVVRFVDELCQKPQLRMLRMAGSPQQQGAEISLGLREPLAFKDVLAKMAGVNRVESNAASKPGGERTVTVHLAAETAEAA